MRAIRLAQLLIVIDVVFMVIYNSYFGWNAEPINEAEKLCDAIYTRTFMVAIIIYCGPMLVIYEKWVKKRLK